MVEIKLVEHSGVCVLKLLDIRLDFRCSITRIYYGNQGFRHCSFSNVYYLKSNVQQYGVS